MKIRRVIVSTLSFVLTASPLAAQTVATSSPVPQPVLTTTGTTTSAGTTTTGSTTTGTTDTTTTPSAYESLSIGNRKIARALFEAQKTETSTTGTGAATGTDTTSTSKNLTLDQIAGLKQSGQGWGQVFKAMQSRGLVTEKNLGQVVSQHSKQHAASRAETVTASNRTDASDATTASATGGKADRSSVGQGHGHSKHTGSTVSARGSDFRGNGGGNGGGNSGGGGSGQGHGKNK